MRIAVLCLFGLATFSSLAGAVMPATDVFLPSVGRGQGACPGGVCSQWRTAVWIHNPDQSSTVAAQVFFLPRSFDNSDPTTVRVDVGPGATVEFPDIFNESFGLDGVFGALRFTAEHDIVVTGRIYDANVQTNLGTGTAGQFFAALPAETAMGVGSGTDLIGLAMDGAGVWRTNFGFVETTGQPAEVLVELIDGTGAVLAARTYTFGGFGTGQQSITDIGGPHGENQRIRATVTSGPGRLLTFASRIDSRTGDPSTVEMVTAPATRTSGAFAGIVLTSDGLRTDGGIQLTVTGDGLTEYGGVTGIPCGDQAFTVDFATPQIPPVAFDAGGNFSTSQVVDYTDAGIPIFTIEWELSGTMLADGVLTGTLTSVTRDGLGVWSACDGTTTRTWQAGWVAAPGDGP